MDKMWYLKQIDIFSDLNKSQLEKVDNIAIHKFLKKKELIYLPGDRNDKVYLLKKGRVKNIPALRRRKRDDDSDPGTR